MTGNQIDHSEGPLSAYRAYRIGQNGKVETSVAIQAESDGGAIEQARTLARDGEVELWDRSRVVIRLPATTVR